MSDNLPAVVADKSKALITAPSQYAAHYSLSELQQIGQAFAQSRMFPDIQQQGQALVKILAGKEMGIAPFAAMTGIHIIKGKATVGANLMASLIKDSGRYDYKVLEHTDKVCRIQFFEHGQPVGVSEFTMDDAKAAGVLGNDTWKKYPKNMLFARAMSNGMRWYCPNATSGQTVYTPEEMGASVDEEGNVLEAPRQAPIDATTPEPAVEAAPDEPNKPLIDDFRASAVHDCAAAGLAVDWPWVNKHLIAASKAVGVRSSYALMQCDAETLNKVLDHAAHEISAEIERHKQDRDAETPQGPPIEVDASPITEPEGQ